MKVSSEDLVGVAAGRGTPDDVVARMTAAGSLVLHTDGSAPVRVRTATQDVRVDVPSVVVVDTVGRG